MILAQLTRSVKSDYSCATKKIASPRILEESRFEQRDLEKETKVERHLCAEMGPWPIFSIVPLR